METKTTETYNKILVTGAAGFIGFHVAKALLELGREVVGLDNLNAYYDITLKEARLKMLEAFPGFRFLRASLEDRPMIEESFAREHFDAPRPVFAIHCRIRIPTSKAMSLDF